MRDSAGVPQFTIGMVEDVTARAATEAALRRREARYRAVVEQAAEGIFLFDAASKRIVEANPACCALLGYREAELTALTLYDLVAHDRASIDANVARIVAEGRNAIGPRTYRRKDGAMVAVEVGATALMADGASLLCVVVRDVGALRASEDKLRAVVENMPLVLFTLDRAGVTTFAAGRGLTALGYTADSALGHAVFADHARGREVAGYVRRALDGESFEARVNAADLVFTTRYAPLTDASGAITGVIGVALDVTGQTRAEADLAEARLRLVAGRETEHLHLARELHDGPVQDVLGARLQLATLAQALPGPAECATLATAQETLYTVSRRLRAICGELRPVLLAHLGLAEAIRAYAESEQARHPLPAIRLNLMPDEQALPEALRLTLYRIFQEALDNAMRHAHAETVAIRLIWDAERVEMEVRDDRRGFTVPTAWYALARAGHLGLLGATERAAIIGARLDIRSAPGAGTTVRIVVPRPDHGTAPLTAPLAAHETNP